MNTKLVNAAAKVIAAAMEQGNQLPTILAITLESAQLLQSPETAELERQRARVAELEYVAPSPSCTRCYGADAERFVAQGGVTAACPVCGPSELEQLRARVAELEEQHEALAERLRAGQHWQRGRTPELVSENYVSQPELRSIFGIPLTAPWDEDPCHPCGCPKRFGRHADGCPAMAAEDDVTPQVTKLRALLAGQREHAQAGDAQ